MDRLLTYRLLLMTTLCFVVNVPNILAQRISFGAFAGAGIDISPVGLQTLSFNNKKKIILRNTEKVTIGKDEDYGIVYLIKAAEGFDIQVDVTSSDILRLEGDIDPTSNNYVPFALGVSYENRGALNPVAARAASIDVPLGFSSFIIPVNSRTSVAPGPPPDPFSGDFSSRPQGQVYLFIYGEAGPVGDVQAGDYTADIIINVTYASY